MTPHPYTIGTPAPLLGSRMRTPFFQLPLGGERISSSLLTSQAALQQAIDGFFARGYGYGLSPYLEYRDTLLSRFPQMADERRFFHLGIDVIAPVQTPLCAPLDGCVTHTGYEDGDGNYGGYVVAQHADIHGSPFFALYGHLDPASLPTQGSLLHAGDIFATLGDRTTNGGWFIHTHVQLLTPRAVNEGWIHRGYCTAQQLPTIELLCPDPLPLLAMNLK